MAVLEHIPIDKVEALFKEFSRILNKNGKIILTTPTPLSQPLLEFLAYRLHIISEAEVRDHKKYYMRDDILLLSGSSDLKIIGYNTFELGLNSLCILEKV
jgi:2-polyprenyl-3-methyl-5-hydroxy-6-metoxy-1,4-benzoquinol methylase